jgi:ankyrin repeat-rich membrane spanning protein
MSSHKSILGQVFGARRLNTNTDTEDMLGYDLYSSALADILTEPTLAMPITVGLFAKWGSGKSFLLGKLREEMKTFTREWIIDPTLKNSSLLLIVIMHIAAIFGVFAWLISYTTSISSTSTDGTTETNNHQNSTIIGIATASTIFVGAYVFLLLLWQGTSRQGTEWSALYDLNVYLAGRFDALKLLLNVMFSHPPGKEFRKTNLMPTVSTQPLRLLFTDQTKVITSSGGQNSVTQMLGSLFDAIENQHGLFASRLFRAFRPQPISTTSPPKWRRLCYIPYVMIYMFCFACILASVVLTAVSVGHHVEESSVDDVPFQNTISSKLPAPNENSNSPVDNTTSESIKPESIKAINSSVNTSVDDVATQESIIIAILLTMAVIVLVVIIANLYTIGNCIKALIFSHRKHLQRAVAKLDLVKSEGYLQAIKNEVQLMLDMIKCLDSFTNQQTRLVVVVDGLDSCEQSKVLSVLDAVHMLFSDEGSPFIILLAIDPHVIEKAIEINIHQAYRDTSIGGNAYLRNIVHLPFFLQNAGLRKVTVAQKLSGSVVPSGQVTGMTGNKRSTSNMWVEHEDNKRSDSHLSVYFSSKKGGANKSSKGLPGGGGAQKQRIDSISSSIGSRLNQITGGNMSGLPQDMTKMSLTDDYFSDITSRSIRRLMNVIYVMGRLLKAFHIDFNWYHLATWVNISEQWPYRLSWIIYYCEQNNDSLEDSTSLKEIYKKIKSIIPVQRDIEPLLSMDRDETKLDTILRVKKHMTLRELKIFLPFSINLDPYIKKVIREENQIIEEGGAMWYPAVPAGHNTAGARAHPTGPLTHRQASTITRKMSTMATSQQFSDPGMLGNGIGHGPSITNGPPNPQAIFPPTLSTVHTTNPAIWPPNHPAAILGVGNAYQMLRNNNNSLQITNEAFNTQSGVNIIREDIDSPIDDDEIEQDENEDTSVRPLSNFTIDDVCGMLRTLDGIMNSRVDTYCDAIQAQNISGTVLSKCSLDELKSVLNMNFGDWELFHLSVLKMRKREKNMIVSRRAQSRDIRNRSRDRVNNSDRSITIEQPLAPNRNQTAHTNSNREINSNSMRVRKQPSSNTHEEVSGESINKKKPSSIETQVNMEDAMISGILSTLNEDAHEDILTEELNNVQKDTDTTSRGHGEGIDNEASGRMISTDSFDIFKKEHSTQATKPSTSTSDTEVIYLSKSAKSSEDRVYQNKENRDVEKNTSGAYRSFCDQIIGDTSNMGNWNISGSQCELNSVPTSPTKSVDTSNSERAQRQISSESSVSYSESKSKNKEKSRYLRDRLESIGPNEVGELPSSSSTTTFKRVNSFNTSFKPMAVHSATNFILSDEPSVRFTHGAAEDVEPYAWLSQTAPASPLNGRSRSCSRSRGEDQYLFYLDGEHDECRKSRGSGQFSSFIIGNVVSY